MERITRVLVEVESEKGLKKLREFVSGLSGSDIVKEREIDPTAMASAFASFLLGIPQTVRFRHFSTLL